MLLVQPPNSSSAVTLGCVTRPPDAPGTIGVSASEPLAQPPMLLDCVGCGVGALGAGSAQAFPPHTSDPEIPGIEESALEVVVAAGAGEDLGWERLKTELVVVEAGAAGAGAGEELEKSNKSFIAEDAGAAGWAGPADDVKSPKPPKALLDCAGLGDGAAAGLELKKLPPLRPENAEDCCRGGDLLLDMLPRPAKASFCGLLGLDILPKLRLLKASFIPPIED